MMVLFVYSLDFTGFCGCWAVVGNGFCFVFVHFSFDGVLFVLFFVFSFVGFGFLLLYLVFLYCCCCGCFVFFRFEVKWGSVGFALSFFLCGVLLSFFFFICSVDE